MFSEHSLRCGGTKYHSCRLFVTALHKADGRARQGKKDFWHRHIDIHPLGLYCFKFGSNWAETGAKSSNALLDAYLSSKKISNETKPAAAVQETVGLGPPPTACIALQKYYLQPHGGA